MAWNNDYTSDTSKSNDVLLVNFTPFYLFIQEMNFKHILTLFSKDTWPIFLTSTHYQNTGSTDANVSNITSSDMLIRNDLMANLIETKNVDSIFSRL